MQLSLALRDTHWKPNENEVLDAASAKMHLVDKGPNGAHPEIGPRRSQIQANISVFPIYTSILKTAFLKIFTLKVFTNLKSCLRVDERPKCKENTA